MTNPTTEYSEERLAALVESYRLLPETIQRVLDAQVRTLREHDARQAEAMVCLEKEHAALVAANTSLRGKNAQLRREIESIDAECSALREEVVTLRAENTAFIEERKATSILVEAFEQFRATVQAADLGAPRAAEQADSTSSVSSDIMAVDRPSEQPIEQDEVCPVDALTGLENRTDIELAGEDNKHEEEVVLTLPVMLIERMDRVIEICHFVSRDDFARAVFAEAVEARLSAADERRSSAGAWPGRRRKERATETAPAPG
jgi:cell division protein FtsB